MKLRLVVNDLSSDRFWKSADKMLRYGVGLNLLVVANSLEEFVQVFVR